MLHTVKREENMIMIKEETQDTRLKQNFWECKKGNPADEQIKLRRA